MITTVKTLPEDASVADVRKQFSDDHVHLVLLVGAGVLRTTLLRSDLPEDLSPDSAAACVGTQAGRTTKPDELVAHVRQTLFDNGLRRLAVVDDHCRLLGLVCLKRDGTGFCDDMGVAERRRSRSDR